MTTAARSASLPIREWMQLVVDRTPHAIGYVRFLGDIPTFTILFDDGVDFRSPYPYSNPFYEPETLPESGIFLATFALRGMRIGLLLRNAFVNCCS